MAGETSKTTNLTAIQAGKRVNRGLTKATVMRTSDTHAFTTGQLEAADVLITAMQIPSNARVSEIRQYNDDLDSSCSPALAFDIGVAAAQDHTSVTSGTETAHSADDVIDADLFVDGDTTGQSATTKFTSLALDSATAGPDDAAKMVWEMLGYDEDPRTVYNVVVTTATAAATAAAGDVAWEIFYTQE